MRLAIALVLLATTAAPAAAAPPHVIALGQGEHPSVAVDANGTAHVVWAMSTPGADENSFNAIGYCRIPAGSERCPMPQMLLPLDPIGGGFGSPVIEAVGGNLQIVDVRGVDNATGGRYTLTSSDGGATWGVHHPTTLQGSGLRTPRQDAVTVVAGDGTISTIGGSYFAFGAPTLFRRFDAQFDVTGIEGAHPEIGSDGVNEGYIEHLALLPDRRLFVIGHHRSLEGTWWRPQITGSDPNAGTSAWGPWRRLGVGRGSVVATAWAREQSGTFLLTSAFADATRVRSFDGIRLGAPQTLGGATDLESGTGHDLTLDPGGRLHAIWRTAAEGCPRERACLVYRRAERGRAFGPKQRIRQISYEKQIGGAHLLPWMPQVAANRKGITWAVWVERTAPIGYTGTIRAAALCTEPPLCGENQAELGGRTVTLAAPRELMTERSFSASVSGQGIDRVDFTLVPPRCTNRQAGCHTLPGPVRVTRRSAPFSTRFAGLPVQAGTSTTDPLKNTVCGAADYLYVVKAVVVRNGARTTLSHDVSYCPRVR